MKKAIALLLAVSALSSCSKSEDTPVVPTPPLPAPQQPIDYIAKIKEFVVPYRIYYEVSFTYDSQKRLTSMSFRIRSMYLWLTRIILLANVLSRLMLSLQEHTLFPQGYSLLTVIFLTVYRK